MNFLEIEGNLAYIKLNIPTPPAFAKAAARQVAFGRECDRLAR
jgi:hypothetical protein